MVNRRILNTMGESLISKLYLLLVSLALVQGASISSFIYAPWGTQVLLQNSTTGYITYSWCNSTGSLTPIYPTDPPLALDLPSTAKNGTSVASTGWSQWDGVVGHPAVTFADVFYLNSVDSITIARYKCNPYNGTFSRIDSASVANLPQVHPQTGLAASTLGATNGERLFFHDINKALHYLSYTNDRGWYYGGIVSPDQNISSLAIASGALSLTTANVSVVLPKDTANMELATFNSDQSWHISTFPQPLKFSNSTLYSDKTNSSTFVVDSTTILSPSQILTNWTGSPGALGFAADQDLTRYIFYISPNRSLSALISSMESGSPGPWTPLPAQPNSIWPPADSASAELALANNPEAYDIRLYYVVNGSLAEIAMTGKAQWEAARLVPANNGSFAAPPASNATGTPALSAGTTALSDLSTSQKAGIGTGVGVAGVALLGALAFLTFRRRRQRHQAGDQANTGANELEKPGVEDPRAEVGTDGELPGWEMPADFVHAQTQPPSELQGDKHFPPHELEIREAREREAREREPCPYSEAWHAANPQHSVVREDRGVEEHRNGE